MKTCRVCNIEKNLNEFSKRENGSQGRRNECKKCLNKARRQQPNYGKWHKLNKKRVSAYMFEYKMIKLYGIDLEKFLEMSEEQDNRCAICKLEKKLVVDHCHNTGKVRGLLCQNCNAGIGFLRESFNNFINAIDYLREHGENDELRPSNNKIY